MRIKLYLLLMAIPLLARGQNDYAVNFAEDALITRTDRFINYVEIDHYAAETEQFRFGDVLNINNSTHYAYQKLFDNFFRAKPGEKIRGVLGYPSNWMHSYIYIDFGKDGVFTPELNDDYTPTANSDLVAFSCYKDHNSLGETVSPGNSVRPPIFTLPADMEPGIYRIRFKLDWDSTDPGGDTTQGLIKNGGGIFDALLCVAGELSAIQVESEHGQILHGDGSPVSGSSVECGDEFIIQTIPDEGYELNSIKLIYGDLSGEEMNHQTPQWLVREFPAYAIKNNRFYISSTYTYGKDLKIVADFVKKQDEQPGTEDYAVNFPKELTHNLTAENKYVRSFSATGNYGAPFTTTVESKPTGDIPVYRYLSDCILHVRPGNTLTPSVAYGGAGMHAYLYVDYNQDGRFNTLLDADGRPTISSELVSYTYADGKNSLGNTVSPEEASMAPMPAFNVHWTTPCGVYRARLKIDRDNTNPGGQYGADDNSIEKNGGAVIDFLLAVHNYEENLTLDTRHGNIYSSGQQALPYLLTPGETLKVVPTPVADGYVLDGDVYIKRGVNLNGDQYVRGNPQWTEEHYDAEDIPTDGISIPLTGDVIVRAYYKPGELPQYNPIFSDEFNAPDGTKFDETKWSSSPRQNAAWNRFMVDSIAVAHHENGNMVLKTIPNTDRSTDNVAMLSGGIQTSGKFSFTYGKVECRAKLYYPRSGSFPAIWMMPQPPCAGWPNAGEIDIFEQINTENRSYHTVHSNWTYNLGYKNNPQSSFSVPCDMDRYHTYGLEWEADQLRWYVDGKQVGSYNRVPANSSQGQWPFDHDFYLILNQSVGTGSWAAAPIESATYRMDVDWIRVYQTNDAYTKIESTADNDTLTLYAQPGELIVKTSSPKEVRLYDLAGRNLLNAVVDGTQTFPLKKGIYVVNRNKVSIP